MFVFFIDVAHVTQIFRVDIGPEANQDYPDIGCWNVPLVWPTPATQKISRRADIGTALVTKKFSFFIPLATDVLFYLLPISNIIKFIESKQL